jgi:hypothetical protein
MRKLLAMMVLLALVSGVHGAAQTTVTTAGGTAGTVPVFNGNASLTNSPLTTANGNVGIGTSSPSAKLGVQALNGIGLLVQGNTNTYEGADITISRTSSANSVGKAPTLQFMDSTGNTASIIQEFQGQTQFWQNGNGAWMRSLTILPSGNVGVGAASPAYKLDVSGTIRSSSGGVVFPDTTTQTTAWTGVLCGGDYAESVNVTGARAQYEPGDVIVIDADNPGKFLKSSGQYSTLVTGVYSTKPGVVGRRQGVGADAANELPMAMIGIVPTKVSAENGPVKPGDLLVTSSTAGYAMKGTDRSQMLGAVIGKALGRLDSGSGVIEAAIALQ